MEYNLNKNLENEYKNIKEEVEHSKNQYECQIFYKKDPLINSMNTCRFIDKTNAATAYKTTSTQSKIHLGATTMRSLSPQVMKYYQKFSQSSNLKDYFKIPILTDVTKSPEHYYDIYKLNHNYKEQDYLNSYVPKERKCWDRPPLIGQPYINGSNTYVRSMIYLQRTNSDNQQQKFYLTDSRKDNISDSSSQHLHSETTFERKTSPTSSIASHKPLEWDSGADVGYLYEIGNQQQLNSNYHFQNYNTVEHIALMHGYSTGLRLYPEGTTEQQQQSSSAITTVLGKPNANSTSLHGSISGSESEVEITPIVKRHTSTAKVDEYVSIKGRRQSKNVNDTWERKKFYNIFTFPCTLKYNLENSKLGVETLPSVVSTNIFKYNSNDTAKIFTLRKSSSMNSLTSPNAELLLKRSQSELNLCKKDKTKPRLIFNSTSSIATVVNNKPITCNKLIQTSIKTFTQESIGVQVSVLKEEEKPPLPKRVTSLASRMLNSILKNTKSTYEIQNEVSTVLSDLNAKAKEVNNKQEDGSSNSTRNSSMTQTDENIDSRINNFNHFSDHIYENVPNSSTSHISSVDTGCSNSTMPNTSSSIDEKIWGDSDSLVRDIERSVNILKSLVDANKLDKHVKKRLIHHVIKRLVSTKYTDDKIEHNLEENVPWNPADARNKVYRTEIIQALAKNTTESSEDWKPSQKKKNTKKSTFTNEIKTMKDVINEPAEMYSSNSDKSGKNTDRTVTDGRKARMGLRSDDCDSSIPTNKSGSSECFLPQREYNNNNKVKDLFITSTSNSFPHDPNRALLDAVVNSRRSSVDSRNETDNSTDWRLPTTVSEHMYDLRRHRNSNLGDIKLVSYAEMEKRNQLIWITNEISHLSNLKKLLEQPKSERINKSLRKIKHEQQIISKHQKFTTTTYKPQTPSSNVTIADDNLLNKQWSSHCNLVNCSLIDTNTIKHLKKRNSCTQTTTDYLLAYSKTGSEVVSAKIQSPNTKLINVYIQTQRSLAPTSSISTISKLYTNCPIHEDVPLNCVCSERICISCKSVHSSQHRLIDNNRQELHNETKFLCNDLEKEIKNQKNKSKSKCLCDINNKINNSSNVKRPKKLTTYNPRCNQHLCEGSTYLCKSCKLPQMFSGEVLRNCECEDNILISDMEKINVNKSLMTNFLDKTNSTSCSCECKKKKEVQNKKIGCNYHSNERVKPYCFISLSKELNNSQEHFCVNETKVGSNSRSKHSMGAVNDSTSECKCCQICGIIYKNTKNCKCVVQNYPKSVAYELFFIDDKKISNPAFSNKVEFEIKSIEKQDLLTNTTSYENKKKKCMCPCLQHTIKRFDYDRGKEKCYKFSSKNKITLQDYLASNNPGFAENVETRRQYVTEIQRLRQRRKDRRIQLLSMETSATDVTTVPKPTIITKYVQRKISDEDVRIRLPKRYFQLAEIRSKHKKQLVQQEIRCNKLMAKIFCKKLQQKVLKGQVDLSQSVSVISNM